MATTTSWLPREVRERNITNKQIAIMITARDGSNHLQMCNKTGDDARGKNVFLCDGGLENEAHIHILLKYAEYMFAVLRRKTLGPCGCTQ